MLFPHLLNRADAATYTSTLTQERSPCSSWLGFGCRRLVTSRAGVTLSPISVAVVAVAFGASSASSSLMSCTGVTVSNVSHEQRRKAVALLVMSSPTRSCSKHSAGGRAHLRADGEEGRDDPRDNVHGGLAGPHCLPPDCAIRIQVEVDRLLRGESPHVVARSHDKHCCCRYEKSGNDVPDCLETGI